jgi:hypothetical protein
MIHAVLKSLLLTGFLALQAAGVGQDHHSIFIEAESFANRGGWVIDQQSMDVMGSPYLLAHGMGTRVPDAETSIQVRKKGNYRVWVRTRDWVAPWEVEGAPGRFQVLFDEKALPVTLGTERENWHWQDGGSIRLRKGPLTIKLHDLTGFEGRCDAILLTSDTGFTPPEKLVTLTDFRRQALGLSEGPEDAGDFDFVVVGGGMAGICAAVSAARLGCRVALIQNRPVLGGNNSSEVRVGLSGLIYQEPYTNLGALVDEVGGIGHWTLWEAQRDPASERSKKILEIIERHPEKKEHNAGPPTNYADDKKLRVVLGEENLSLFLNTHVMAAEKEGDHIISVTGRSIISGKEYRFRGKLFADCTGDGNLGLLAGADFRVGREAISETGEPRAPVQADLLVMGTSVQWNTTRMDQPVVFPTTQPWSVRFDEKTTVKTLKGDWDWETGAERDQVREIEAIRDYALRVIYGNWDFLKNQSVDKGDFARHKLDWVAYIGGKRESRRLLGDIVLKEQDILEGRKFPDGSFTTTWDVDLHFPVRKDGFTGESFQSRADMRKIKPYQVPYRSLYSRNVSNLLMAGRNISVTHVALGTIRVQRTTGMAGEVIGMAASVCILKSCFPRDVYERYFSALETLMSAGIGNPDW